MVHDDELLDEPETDLNEEDEVAHEVREAFIPFTSRRRQAERDHLTPAQAEAKVHKRTTQRYGGQPTEDDVTKQEERYQRLIALGATERHARDGSRDIGAFNAARIYYRGK